MSSDPSPPTRPGGIDVHKIWYHSPEHPMVIVNYLMSLEEYFSTKGAIVGPDDWYVSEVATYKDKKGLRHELLMATIQRTPREPRQNKEGSDSDSRPDENPTVTGQAQTDDISEHQTGFLAIERSMDRVQNKEGASRSGRSHGRSHEKANDGNTSSSSGDSSKESLRMKNYTVRFLSGKKPALDEVTHKLPSHDMSKYDLMGRMVLPKPPTLPAEDDFDAVISQLSASTPPLQDASSASSSSNTPTAPPLPPSQRFISVPALICLANTVSEYEKLYSIAECNCYWYCSMLFYTLREYTRAEIILQQDGKITRIGPEDSPMVVQKKFNQANLEPGRFSSFDIVYPPSGHTINSILSNWATKREKMDNDYRQKRLAYIVERFVKPRETSRQAAEMAKKAEDADERAVAAEAARDQALKDKAAKAREAAEMAKKAKEADEMVAAAEAARDQALEDKAAKAREASELAKKVAEAEAARDQTLKDKAREAAEMAKKIAEAEAARDQALGLMRDLLAAQGIDPTRLQDRNN